MGEDIWKAFFARKMQFKVPLSEDLKDPDKAPDWALLMEAFRTLTDPEERALYEHRNLSPHARGQLNGLRVFHLEQLRRNELAAIAQAKADEEAAEAARLAAEAAAEEAANPKSKKSVK